MNKFYSGRFWLTIVAGLVFAYCACTQVLQPEATAAILTAVFTSYFQRTDRQAQAVARAAAQTVQPLAPMPRV